jgi:hypothetical protein
MEIKPRNALGKEWGATGMEKHRIRREVNQAWCPLTKDSQGFGTDDPGLIQPDEVVRAIHGLKKGPVLGSHQGTDTQTPGHMERDPPCMPVELRTAALRHAAAQFSQGLQPRSGGRSLVDLTPIEDIQGREVHLMANQNVVGCGTRPETNMMRVKTRPPGWPISM